MHEACPARDTTVVPGLRLRLLLLQRKGCTMFLWWWLWQPAGRLRWPAHTALHQLAHAVVVQGITEAGQAVVLHTLEWRLHGVFKSWRR